MAIYDLGTASLAANGEVTGVGTTWKAPLTLIRVGATIIFKTEPVQIYTISEIISDTHINVYNPDSETVPAGTGYAILAHDGITVQGLAQDVAETLRYYQSRETEVADAVDAFNNFDAADFESKVNQVNIQHGDVVSIGAQVANDAAQVSSDKASAAASAASALADKNSAAQSAIEAANSAASLNTDNLLKVDLNLSDLDDVETARANLNAAPLSGYRMLNAVNYGVPSDGTTDATQLLQQFINESKGDIDLGGGTFLLSKSQTLAAIHPTEPDFINEGIDFSPCLALVKKRGIKIHNGKLVVKTHGLDALSLVDCENVTVSLDIYGPGKFPAIDPLSGYAEKGEPSFGYDSSLILGPNNAVDSSTYTSGTFDMTFGSFPVYDSNGDRISGQSRSSWGAFLGGYIGSWASGIKVQRACRSINIDNCMITGFNFAGVGIGFANKRVVYGFTDYTKDDDVPVNISVSSCTISNCYSAGIYVISGRNLTYSENRIYDIGHPDGDDVVNASFDPGYGISHSRNRRISNVNITGNFFNNCRRKSIDFHGGGKAIITGNHCNDTGVVGIYAKCGVGWSPNYESYNFIISNNYVTTRKIPDSKVSTSYPSLAGAKYSRCIDFGGGGEATKPTYQYPFFKVFGNYCELNAYDGVAIASGAGDSSYITPDDINIESNTVVLAYGSGSVAQSIVVDAGASSSQSYPLQSVKLINNSVKVFQSLGLSFRSIGYVIQGIPKSIVANGNTLDLGGYAQSGSLASLNINSATSYSVSGNLVVNPATRSSADINDVFFYDNITISRAASSKLLTISGTLFRGVWDIYMAGSGDAFGSRYVSFASTGSGGTGYDVARSAQSGTTINSVGVSSSGITIPATTTSSDFTINLTLKVKYP